MAFRSYMLNLGDADPFSIYRTRTPIRILKSQNPPTAMNVAPVINSINQNRKPTTLRNSFQSDEEEDGFLTYSDPLTNKTHKISNTFKSEAKVCFSSVSNVSSTSHSMAKQRKTMPIPRNIVVNDPSNRTSGGQEYILNLDSDGTGHGPDSDEMDYSFDSDGIGIGDESDEAEQKEITYGEGPSQLKISNVVTLSERRMKNSDHIKRPLNAFMAFSKVERRRIMNSYPMMHHAAVSKRLGATWKALTSAQKKPYFDEAKKLAEEHLVKYPNYKYKPRPKRIRPDEKSAQVNSKQPLKKCTIGTTSPDSKSTDLKQAGTDLKRNAKAISATDKKDTSGFHSWSLIYESEEEDECEDNMDQ